MAAKKKKESPSLKDFYVVMTGIDPRIEFEGFVGERCEVDIYDISDPSKIDLDYYNEEDEVYVYKLTPLFEVKRKSTLEKISVDSE